MLVIADDLSGAVEVAAVLGLRRISLDAREVREAVVDLDTRRLGPAEATARVRELVTRHDGERVFKKIDSLLRGNVAAELAVLRDPVVVPALPVEGRTVRGGVLHVDGAPRPTPVACHDAETDEDLDAIVAAHPGATLVGSAGLAAALGRALDAQPLPPPVRTGRPLLIGVGTPAADEQVARLGRAVIRGTAEEVARQITAAPDADLVLTGGETARRTLDALGIRSLQTVGQIYHGAVQCRAGDRHITIRPGNFGGPDGLARIVEALT
jgi:4-phospho-D-threonate 3-dehydrogenase / 4-phospho-D-erythronate 3-dehydrogenase